MLLYHYMSNYLPFQMLPILLHTSPTAPELDGEQCEHYVVCETMLRR